MMTIQLQERVYCADVVSNPFFEHMFATLKRIISELTHLALLMKNTALHAVKSLTDQIYQIDIRMRMLLGLNIMSNPLYIVYIY